MNIEALDAYWKATPGPPRHGAGLLRPLGVAMVRTAWRIRMHGRHHVPQDGPVILAANHTGLLDGPLVYATMPRPVYALVKAEMFHGPVGSLLRRLGQIPVDRFAPDPAAVKSSLAVLERGDVLAIYPEGTRGAGDFARIKPGVAYLALCTGAPIVPVACLGVRAPGRSTDSLPRVRATLDVVFGRPLRLDRIGWPRRRAVVRESAAWVQAALVEHVREACRATGRRLPDAVTGPAPTRPVAEETPAERQDPLAEKE